MKSLHIIVSGRVQGVGFRFFTQEIAVNLHITGWVKNLSNGDVEIYAEGSKEILEKFLLLIKKGPPLSRILNIEEYWNDLDKNEFDSFTIKYY